MAGLPRTMHMEEFSRGYMHALAARAGCVSLPYSPDVDSLDLILVRPGVHRHTVAPHLSVQLKSTSRARFVDGVLHYPLEVPAYNRLRLANGSAPAILVVLALPTQLRDWVEYTPDELCLRHRAYWGYLVPLEATENTSTVTVRLSDLLTAESLIGIMHRVQGGVLV